MKRTSGWWMWKRLSTGTAGDTSSPPPLRPCAVSLSSGRAASTVGAGADACGEWNSMRAPCWSPQAVSRDQRTDRSPHVSAGHLGRSTDAQPEVTWLDKLLLSGDAGPGLRRGAEARASQATPVAVFEAQGADSGICTLSQ